VLTVPSYEDIVSGRVMVSSLRTVELDDLLGRDPVQLDSDGLRSWLGSLTVMVTGAGGSIGSELCRQIARFQPALIVMVEQSEYALYRITEEFAASFPGVRTEAVIADVKDQARTLEVLQRWQPAVIFHAAAYKHVPLMENGNAWEAVQNNVWGTMAIARAAAAAGVDKFVLVSTDKAVNPVNVMGATKRLAEKVCATLTGAKTRFVTVRFGNVIGSAGSVVPKFREQIAQGGPVTVTHPDIERYFMSIPEAAQLVLQAGLMGEGREIFVLDMGEPVKIVDLARDLIRLSGLSESDVRIEFTGLRPGEKLYEEPLADNEGTLATPHPKLRIARATDGLAAAELDSLRAWLRGASPGSADAVRNGLKGFIPEYQPAK
jgi:FlaA1/EpsC-like NDP-sugar epimerase